MLYNPIGSPQSFADVNAYILGTREDMRQDFEVFRWGISLLCNVKAELDDVLCH